MLLKTPNETFLRITRYQVNYNTSRCYEAPFKEGLSNLRPSLRPSLRSNAIIYGLVFINQKVSFHMIKSNWSRLLISCTGATCIVKAMTLKVGRRKDMAAVEVRDCMCNLSVK